MNFLSKYKKTIASLILLAVVAGVLMISPSRRANAGALTWGLGAAGLIAGGAAIVAAAPVALPAIFGGAAAAGTAAGGASILWTGLAAAGSAVIGHIPAILAIGAAGEISDVAQGGTVGSATKTVIRTVAAFIRTLAGGLLDLTAKMFEWTIQMNFLTAFNKIPIVITGWVLLRDLTNMLFIFALLYVAIGTMLQLSGINWKTTLTSIVLAALFVNFSLFITGLFIDGSNILTMEFYDAIVGNNTPPRTIANMITQESAIAVALGRKDTWGGMGASQATAGQSNGSNSASNLPDEDSYWINAIVSIVLLVVLVRFFFVNALLFVGRIITIMFLMMTAPLAFAGSALAPVLPEIKQYVNRWWTTLFNQVLLAPFIMFVLYIVLSLVPSTGGDGGRAVFLLKQAQVGDPNSTAQYLWYLQYVIIVGFLTFGVSEAKKFAGELGTAVLSVGQMGAKVLTGGVLGGVAVLGSETIGRAMENSRFGKDWKPESIGGKFIKKYVTEKISGGSYDVRAIPGLSEAFGHAIDSSSLGAAINKGGYSENMAAEEMKNMKEVAENIKTSRAIEERVREERRAAGLSITEADPAFRAAVRAARGEALATQMQRISQGSRGQFYAEMSGADKQLAYAGMTPQDRDRMRQYGDQNLRGLQRSEHLLMTAVEDHRWGDVPRALAVAGDDIGKLPARLLAVENVFQRFNSGQLSLLQEARVFAGDIEHKTAIYQHHRDHGTAETRAHMATDLSRSYWDADYEPIGGRRRERRARGGGPAAGGGAGGGPAGPVPPPAAGGPAAGAPAGGGPGAGGPVI